MNLSSKKNRHVGQKLKGVAANKKTSYKPDATQPKKILLVGKFIKGKTIGFTHKNKMDCSIYQELRSVFNIVEENKADTLVCALWTFWVDPSTVQNRVQRVLKNAPSCLKMIVFEVCLKGGHKDPYIVICSRLRPPNKWEHRMFHQCIFKGRDAVSVVNGLEHEDFFRERRFGNTLVLACGEAGVMTENKKVKPNKKSEIIEEISKFGIIVNPTHTKMSGRAVNVDEWKRKFSKERRVYISVGNRKVKRIKSSSAPLWDIWYNGARIENRNEVDQEHTGEGNNVLRWKFYEMPGQ